MKIVAFKTKNKSIEDRLIRIKNDDKLERELFIEEYIPFVVKVTARFLGGYVDLHNSDEYSVALLAFNEAINKYELNKGSFINFASLVINNRLKDYKISNKKHFSNVPIDEKVMNDGGLIEKSDFTERLDIKNEIELFTVKLNAFNIQMTDLVAESPKHQKTRVRSVKMAKYIIDVEELKANFYRLKRLPVLILSKAFKVAVKTIKRSRKFTIATTIVLDSDLQLIKSRVLQIERGEEDV
ncbi:hypothetical protein EZV73_09640 [Acidaminobacter sp. JC074]|uniref:sigma factor n=1 Tax=Acidaminobacter sp. JC074 TaxID=2530199 RepID=UPI001F109FC1|nr:sigma factor [Acidaminobacter sp. JC074]MCH4887836.1 hypothetical protein [Acidaminobacter sp. JC074]